MMQSLNNKLFAKYDKAIVSYLFDRQEMRGNNENIAKDKARNIREATFVRPCIGSQGKSDTRAIDEHVYARIGNTDEVRQKEDRDRETAGWMAGSVSNYRLLITPPDPSVRRFTQEQSPTPTSRKVEDPHLGSQ